jgi:hypothetical protein
MSYYVDMNGLTAGPFSIEEMAKLYQSNALQETSLYARLGSQEWLPIRTLLPLFNQSMAVQTRELPPVQQRRPVASVKDSLCLSCHAVVDAPMRQTKGSFWVELALWIFFCLPGLIYSIWRLTSRQQVCPYCGHGNLIPAASPRGREMVDVYIPASKPGWSHKFGRWCGRVARATGRGIHKVIVPEKPAAPKQVSETEVVE